MLHSSRVFPSHVHLRGAGLLRFCMLGVTIFLAGPALFGQDLSLEEFRKLNNDLREKMSEDMDAAESYLEDLIKKSPESGDLNVLRESLASKWASDGKYDRAYKQLDQLLDFQTANLQNASNRFGVPMTIQAFRQVTDDSNNTKIFRKAIDRAYEALASAEIDDAEQLIPLAQLAVLKAQSLADQDETSDAYEIVQSITKRLSEAADESVDVTQSLIQTLRAFTASDPANDAWREELIDQLSSAVKDAMDAYPKSAPIQTSFAEVEFLRITQWEQDDPEAMKEQIGETVKRLNPMALRNRSVNAILRRLVLHRERMTAAKPVASLVGQMAPKWEVDAWVNVIDMDRESLKGKVVLIDFWAMWCGPCIATFPHLRDWREEFSEEGFEIVGVTQYYNYRWDDEKKRPAPSTDEADPAAEREAIDKFLQHYELKHPVMVTPDNSDMSSAYGVQGIPHVVLLDQEGVVQLVKTGAGQATADEIEAKIRELLDKKKDS